MSLTIGANARVSRVVSLVLAVIWSAIIRFFQRLRRRARA